MDRKYLLRVANYEYFIASITTTSHYYIPPHQILADLEKEVCFTNDPDTSVLIDYKEWGGCVFDFDRFMRDGNDVFIIYNYINTAS